MDSYGVKTEVLGKASKQGQHTFVVPWLTNLTVDYQKEDLAYVKFAENW